MVGTTLLIIVLPTQSMQLFVGTDCAMAMKKPNNTKSCSYCSGRERGASRGLSMRRRRRRRRGLKKKAKNYAKNGPHFCCSYCKHRNKRNKETKECVQKQTVAAAAPCSLLCCLPPTPLKNGPKNKTLPLYSSIFWYFHTTLTCCSQEKLGFAKSQ
jgi:hypothetical protein